LAKYSAASELDPLEPNYRKAFERLLEKTRH